MRCSSLVGLLPVLALAPGCGPVVLSRSLEVEELVRTLLVEVDVGDVEVRGGKGDMTDLRIEGEGPAQGFEVSWQVDGDVLKVVGTCDVPEQCSLDVQLVVPEDIDLSVDVGVGRIGVDTLSGDLALHVDDGDILASGLTAGAATMTTDRGDLEIGYDRSPSLLVADTSAGAVSVMVPTGAYRLDLQADGGSVALEGVTPDEAAPFAIESWTGAGDIRLTGFRNDGSPALPGKGMR